MEKLLQTQFPEILDGILREAELAKDSLFERSGFGLEMTKWLEWPGKYIYSEEYAQIKDVAKEIRCRDDAVVVIGSGGEYLGARAVIEAELGAYHNEFGASRIYFVGSDLSPCEVSDIETLVVNTSFSIIYITKSGETIESALLFRYFYKLLREQFEETEANQRVIVITRKSGDLYSHAEMKKWKTFTMQEGICGRHSVLTSAGILLIAIAGIDTDALLEGAIDAMQYEAIQQAAQYAAYRWQSEWCACCEVEFLAVNSQRLKLFGEWHKQLFAESEWQVDQGIIPTNGIIPVDMHFVGQYLEDVTRDLIFETQIIREFKTRIPIPEGDEEDGLNMYLGKSINDVADAIMESSAKVHENSNTPVGKIYVKSSTQALGYLMQFMIIASSISGYMHDINPFEEYTLESNNAMIKKALGED